MKIIFYYIISFFSFFYVKNQRLQEITGSNTVEMILKNDKLIYVNNETDTITIYDININNANPVPNSEIKKNKILIDLDNDKFIIIGIANNFSLIYNIYNDISNYNSPIKVGSFQYSLLPYIHYSIRKVTENIYILFYINNNNCIVFKLEFGKNPIGGIKQIPENTKDINTLECDSFDGEYIFCVYSLIEYDINDDIIYIESFYSFKEINENNLEKNSIIDNPEIASIAKIEDDNEKKFILCYFKSYTDKTNPDGAIYCQFYIQKGSDIIYENSYKIASTKEYMNKLNYERRIPIKIKQYGYSIFLFLDVTLNGDNKNSLLYISTLDLQLNIQDNIDDNRFNNEQNILINDKYRIIYKGMENSIRTIIEYRFLSFICKENLIYQFNIQKQSINITDDLVDDGKKAYFLLFSPDSLTYLYIGNDRMMGGLDGRLIKNVHDIILKNNKNLKKSNNYYIYYTKTPGGNYITSTNYCLFKVINCYETCKECNTEIEGTLENQQCLSCQTDYYRYNNYQNQNGFYNCYEANDPKVAEGVYLVKSDNLFYKCDISCKKCENNKTCITCNDGYYFTKDSINGNKLNDICYNSIPDHNYYLDTNSNLNYNGTIINFVYKKCYDTCYSCFGGGDRKNNRCTRCKNDYIKYNFDDTKCTINNNDCSIWEIDDDRNIKCLSQCDDFLIYEGINKNQCVKNCQYYFNPFNTSQIEPLLSYECDSYKFCITYNFCKSKKLISDIYKCYPPSIGCVDLDTYIPPIEIETSIISEYIINSTDYKEKEKEEKDEKDKDKDTNWIINSDNIKLKNRVKFIKIYNFENLNYSEVNNNFIVNQTNRYNNELNKELETHIGEYLDGIDFITLSRYKDFIITFYPLQAENYVYYNLLELNNLCFINFTKFFNDINYIIYNENYIILIGLIEHKNENLPINSINYFLILYDEVNNIPIKQINLNLDINSSSSSYFEVSYPLYNFENSEIDKKYSTNLISTIKELYSTDKELIFFNKHDKLFNDICYIYTSNENTDITIEDRIKDYYLDINLCENNCTLSTIYDKEENKNPRSLCNCQIKENLDITDENYSFNINKNFKQSKSNINALSCGKEVFAENKISSNSIFWFFIIFLFIEIILIIKIFCCGKSTIENMLKTKKINKPIEPEKNNNKEKNENIYNNIYIDNKTMNKIEKLSNNDFSKNKYKSVKLQDDLKSSMRNINKYKKNIILTTPIKNSENNPPKRKSLISNNKINNYLINNKGNSNNETSLFESEHNNNKNPNKSSTFEDIYDPDNNNQFKQNNYLFKEKNFKENNYFGYRKKQNFKIIKSAISPLDKSDNNINNNNKYLNTNNGINDDDYNPYRKSKENLILSDIEYRKYYHTDIDKDENEQNIIPDISKIKNNRTKLFEGESELSVEKRLFQPDNNDNANNNLIEDDNKKDTIENNKENENNENNENEIEKDENENENNENKSSEIQDNKINETENNDINENININEINNNTSNDINKIDDNNNDDNNNNDNDNMNNRKNLSYDFKYKFNDSNSLIEDNHSNKTYKNRNSKINLKSKNIELLKKNKKKTRRKILSIKNKNSLKNSLNMSVNSNNNFLNNKSEHYTNTKNNEENPKNKKSENYFNSQNKYSENDEIIYNKKNLLSSTSSIYDKDNSYELNKNDNCICFYWKYFIKREIFLASFYNKYDNIAFFIRISTFIFAISFIFMINCLLLTTSDIHNRYIYAKENKKIKEIKYIFGHEFLKIFLCALISIIFKILCIKIFYGNCIFKISNTIKDDISPFTERNLNEKEFNELNDKRKQFINKYWIKSIIFVIIQTALLFIFGYISICYIGTFPNTFAGIIGRFFISLIFSFIICAFICFIIVIFGRNGCKGCYNFIKKIY